ncbi:hypothetical protein [Amycolatopsis sp. NPDC058986]|uniref:hypothetical protein n=1 Tax=unclassified Amycolatopsis TaxID=2618356 RepID=UPI00366C58B5
MTSDSDQEGAADSASHRFELSLSFSQIRCQRCGVNRIRGVACPDCGAAAAPQEFDAKRQKRQKVARAALARLELSVDDDTIPIVPPGEIANILIEVLDEVLDDVFVSLRTALRDSARVDELNKSIDTLRYCSALVASLKHLRPWYRLIASAAALVDELRQTVVGFLNAVLAETPLEAQRAAEAGQGHLNEAARLIPEMMGSAKVWTAGGDSVGELMTVALNASLQDTSSANVFELDAIGRNRGLEIFGTDVEIGPGLGIMIAIQDAIAKQFFDVANFENIMRESRAFLTSRPAKLQETLNSSHLKSDLTEAAATQTTASMLLSVIEAAKLPNHANVMAMIDLGKTAMESLGKRVTAAIQSVAGRSSYDRLRTSDMSGVLNNAQRGSAGSVLSGLDLAIRHAGAHADFKVQVDHVVLTPSSRPVELRFDEFTDYFIRNIEVVCANYIALIVAASQNGVDLADLSMLDALGLSLEEKVNLMLHAHGWQTYEVSLSDGELIVHSILSPDCPFMEPAHLLANSVLPEEIERMTLYVGTLNGPRHTLEGPVAVCRSEAWDVENLVEMGALWRIDGRPLIYPEVLRNWISGQCIEAGNLSIADAVKRLRRLRATATAAEDSELAAAVEARIREVRSNPVLELENNRTSPTRALYDWRSSRPSLKRGLMINSLAALAA